MTLKVPLYLAVQSCHTNSAQCLFTPTVPSLHSYLLCQVPMHTGTVLSPHAHRHCAESPFTLALCRVPIRAHRLTAPSQNPGSRAGPVSSERSGDRSFTSQGARSAQPCSGALVLVQGRRLWPQDGWPDASQAPWHRWQEGLPWEPGELGVRVSLPLWGSFSVWGGGHTDLPAAPNPGFSLFCQRAPGALAPRAEGTRRV